MFAYLVRKTIFSIVVLFFSSIVIFGLVALGPDPLTELKLNPRVTQADIDRRITAQYGLDQPLPIQYGIWMKDIVLHGDFGTSFKQNTSVNSIIALRIWPTVLLMGTSLIVTVLIAIPFGIYSAIKKHSALDNTNVSLVRGLQHADLLVGTHSPARIRRLPYELGRVSRLFHLGYEQRERRGYRGPTTTSRPPRHNALGDQRRRVQQVPTQCHAGRAGF